MKRLLLAAALVLMAILSVQWMDWPEPLPALSDAGAPTAQERSPTTQAHSAASPNLNLLQPEEDYVSVMERPLFLPDRRPLPDAPAEAAAADPSAEAADLAHLDVSATLILAPDQASVWVRDQQRQDLLRLRLGDDYEGWTVAEITPNNIRMERQGVTETLELFNYSAPVSPARRLPTRVNQQPDRPSNRRQRQPAGQQPGPK